MSNCYRCKWNTATLEEKQEHCLACNFKDIESLSKHHKITWLDNTSRDDAIINQYAVETEPDYWENSGIENVDQYTMILNFCKHFSELNITDRLVLLAMFDCGGVNKKIVEETGKCLQTVIMSRKRIEAHPFWGKMLRRMSIEPRQTRIRGKKVKNSDTENQAKNQKGTVKDETERGSLTKDFI